MKYVLAFVKGLIVNEMYLGFLRWTHYQWNYVGFLLMGL